MNKEKVDSLTFHLLTCITWTIQVDDDYNKQTNAIRNRVNNCDGIG
jgi:hypothetical protein